MFKFTFQQPDLEGYARCLEIVTVFLEAQLEIVEKLQNMSGPAAADQHLAK